MTQTPSKPLKDEKVAQSDLRLVRCDCIIDIVYTYHDDPRCMSRGHRVILLRYNTLDGGHIEILNVKVGVFILLLFASLPDCSQNQTAVSDTLRLLSDF
jgi:hypothetical protein